MTAPRHEIEAVLAGRCWRDDARCRQADPEAFFPEKSGSTKLAKRVCAACPVRAECLAEAIRGREPHGVWGGMSPRERQTYARQAAAPARAKRAA